MQFQRRAPAPLNRAQQFQSRQQARQMPNDDLQKRLHQQSCQLCQLHSIPLDDIVPYVNRAIGGETRWIHPPQFPAALLAPCPPWAHVTPASMGNALLANLHFAFLEPSVRQLGPVTLGTWFLNKIGSTEKTIADNVNASQKLWSDPRSLAAMLVGELLSDQTLYTGVGIIIKSILPTSIMETRIRDLSPKEIGYWWGEKITKDIPLAQELSSNPTMLTMFVTAEFFPEETHQLGITLKERLDLRQYPGLSAVPAAEFGASFMGWFLDHQFGEDPFHDNESEDFAVTLLLIFAVRFGLEGSGDLTTTDILSNSRHLAQDARIQSLEAKEVLIRSSVFQLQRSEETIEAIRVAAEEDNHCKARQEGHACSVASGCASCRLSVAKHRESSIALDPENQQSPVRSPWAGAIERSQQAKASDIGNASTPAGSQPMSREQNLSGETLVESSP